MIRQVAIVFALLILTGCGGPDVKRTHTLATPIATRMDVEVRLLQHKIIVSHAVSTAATAAALQEASSPNVAAGGFAAGAAAGLIGALVDGAINAHREHVAEEMAAPIQQRTSSLDIDQIIYRSFDSLDKSQFASDMEIERLSSSTGEDEKPQQITTGDNILVLVPSYSISYDEKNFVYSLLAKLVDRTKDTNGKLKTTTRYSQVFEFILPATMTPGGAAWGSLSPDQWQDILTNAATQTVAMLNYDIHAMPSNDEPEMAYDKFAVLVDTTRGDRSWVRTQFALLDVPTAQIHPDTGWGSESSAKPAAR